MGLNLTSKRAHARPSVDVDRGVLLGSLPRPFQSCGECSVVGSEYEITCLSHASQIWVISGVSRCSPW